MLRQAQNDRFCQVMLSASEAAAAGLAAPRHQAGVRGQNLSQTKSQAGSIGPALDSWRWVPQVGMP